jgi:glycosyltransferase involved in cell wall biosynthesis
MLAGENILYFSADDWGCGLSTSQTHIARVLARNNRILYINSIGLRKPGIKKHDFKKIANKLAKFSKGVTQVADNIWVFTPIVLPFYNYECCNRINTRLMITLIRYHLKKLNMKNPIFWSFLPNTVRLIGKLNESKVVYYCVDEYSAFDGVPSAAIQQQEQKFIRKSDVVFTTSLKLYESKRQGNPRTYYCPHGVDLAHFKKAMTDDLQIPADIDKISHPIIGFYGLVESWIDVEMIARVAQLKPEWSFVFIGDVRIDIERFQSMSNMHFLGQKRYEDLPAYNKAFDVAIMPFVKSELTKNVNPIKLREYLAAGTSVVASILPELNSFRDVIYLYENQHDFISMVELALKEKGPIPMEERLQFIAKDSWEQRLEDISKIILQR